MIQGILEERKVRTVSTGDPMRELPVIVESTSRLHMFERSLIPVPKPREGQNTRQTKTCNTPRGPYTVELVALGTVEDAIHSFVFVCVANVARKAENLAIRMIFPSKNGLESQSIMPHPPAARRISRKLCLERKKERERRAFLETNLECRLPFQLARLSREFICTLLIRFVGERTNSRLVLI
jgi:hypothetical protein